MDGDISIFGGLMVNWGITIAIIMVVLGALGAVAGSVMSFIQDTSNLKQGLIGLGAFVVVLVIAYVMASDTLPGEKFENLEAGTIKNVGAGIYAFYFLSFVAVASAVYAEVSKLFK